MKIRIVLADDHPVILAGIHHSLSCVSELDVVGQARDSGELVRLLQHQPCDVLITDYAMPHGEFGDGIALMTYLRKNHQDVKIIVYTTMNNPALNAAMLELGVFAVLNKTSDTALLIRSIHSAYKETRVPDHSGLSDGYPVSRHLPLSKREEDVIRLYVLGLSVNDIAQRLERTKQTISSQKSNAMQKLGLVKDADLFRFALETGLVDRLLEEDAARGAPPAGGES